MGGELPNSGLPVTVRDSLRFYYLGNRYENKIERFGAKVTYGPEDALML